MPKYIVESANVLATYTTEEPQDAVTAFLRERPEAEAATLTVYVADYIGKFKRESVIKRLPETEAQRRWLVAEP